jgi:hypothetical protein
VFVEHASTSDVTSQVTSEHPMDPGMSWAVQAWVTAWWLNDADVHGPIELASAAPARIISADNYTFSQWKRACAQQTPGQWTLGASSLALMQAAHMAELTRSWTSVPCLAALQDPPAHEHQVSTAVACRSQGSLGVDAPMVTPRRPRCWPIAGQRKRTTCTCQPSQARQACSERR